MILTMTWQRLVTDEGGTCERCGSTQDEFRKAVETLRATLKPLGITVESSEEELTPEEFAAKPAESNRIFVDGRSLEDWLEGSAGLSPCESCCDAIGDSVACRTVKVDGTTHEVVPADLIVRAGLAAAARFLGDRPKDSCCSSGGCCG